MKRAMILILIILAGASFVIYRAIATNEAFMSGEVIYATPPEFKKLDIPVKKLLEEPKDGAKVVYEIPLTVKLLAVTRDKKWYKARIAYNFLGHFQTEGWVKVE